VSALRSKQTRGFTVGDMRLTGLFLFCVTLLGFALATNFVSVVHADVMNDVILQQLKSCNRACISEAEKCTKNPGLNHSYCDTHEISCVASCQVCIKNFANCMNVSDQAMSFCQNVFNACLDEKLNANHAREHIPIVFKGGNGLSFDTPVIIEGILSEQETGLAENLWMSRNHPTWRKTAQAIVKQRGRSFDKIDYKAEDGSHTVWFDITAAFEKTPE